MSLQSAFSPGPQFRPPVWFRHVLPDFRREVLELLIGQRPQEGNQRRLLIVSKVERPDERRQEGIRTSARVVEVNDILERGQASEPDADVEQLRRPKAGEPIGRQRSATSSAATTSRFTSETYAAR